MSYDWLKLQCDIAGQQVPARHTIFTVNGTGSPDPINGWGFSSELAHTLDDELYYWQPIGYPAATFPMGPSVQVGRQELVNQINLHPGKFAMSGYSQGALVTDFVWRDDILNPSGVLNHRLQDVIGIVNFGDPMRCPGICNGNLRAGFAIPKAVDGYTTGGIAGTNDLQPIHTPDFLLSCNNDGDLYGAAPVGDTPWIKQNPVGHDETLIFDLVQNFNGENVLAFTEEVAAILTGPDHDIAVVEAIMNGGLFVLQGFGPHGDYEKFIPAMTDFLMEVGKAAA